MRREAATQIPAMATCLPQHVGLIPDGARRWSRKNNVSLLNAYNLTMKGLVDFIDQSFRLGVEAVSIFLLSVDNLGRNGEELESVLTAEEDFLRSSLTPVVRSHKVRVAHAGRKDLLPTSYVDAITSLCSVEAPRVDRRLYLLAAYDPIDEVKEAVQLRGGGWEKGLEKLWVPERVDLVIRTGGDFRLSGFLPIQSSYAELVFLPRFFNELSCRDLVDPILSYQTIARRFGL